MTLALAVWLALGMVTILLVVMTVQLVTHDPAVCRRCVDRDARAAVRSRHPSFVPAEEWGRM